MLNRIEEEALEIIQRVLDAISIGKISRLEYRDLLGAMRDIAAKLTNKKFGCATGRHTAACQCKE
jgi:hypothetical protein